MLKTTVEGNYKDGAMFELWKFCKKCIFEWFIKLKAKIMTTISTDETLVRTVKKQLYRRFFRWGLVLVNVVWVLFFISLIFENGFPNLDEDLLIFLSLCSTFIINIIFVNKKTPYNDRSIPKSIIGLWIDNRWLKLKKRNEELYSEINNGRGIDRANSVQID